MDNSTSDILSGVVRIVIAVVVLIIAVSQFNNPPVYDEPVEEAPKELAAPEESFEVIEWYPTMTPDIIFDEGNGGNRPWGN